jgi:hypothetical protein
LRFVTVAVVVSRVLEHLRETDFFGVLLDALGQFGLAVLVPPRRVVVQPRLVVVVAEHRREREVVGEVFGVGLGRLADRTGVSHARA